MKKILIYISPEKYSSLFDLILGYDGGADIVVPYSDTGDEDIRDVVYSCVYTRGSNGRKNTAIFIGGPDVNKGEEFMNAILSIFKELPEDFRVSVVADPHGAHTTSSSCVVKIKKAAGDLKGKNATILAGTGPVGQSIATLLSEQGCNVTITSRELSKAKNICDIIKEKHGATVKPFEAGDQKTIEKSVAEADIVVATGPEGITLLPKKTLSRNKRIKVLADVNAVAPHGIEDVDPRDDCKKGADGRIRIGALSIGSLKIKVHHRIVEKLFEEKGQVLDLEKIYLVAEKIAE
ncbi:MAG: methylene-tetrahydromethanopterin dehydrogenase N-terminal domain-containing protein [Candidatus Altiarchaeia archaeon]